MDVFIRDVVKSKLGYVMKEEEVVAVKAILEGKDIFVVLPTGYGKSLCYMALPFLFDTMGSEEGSIIIVVTPLTAIIKDQVKIISFIYNNRSLSRYLLVKGRV